MPKQKKKAQKGMKKPKKGGKILERHKRVLKNVGKSGKLKTAMEEEHYEKNYIDSGNIKNTTSWQKLMETHLSDDLLAEKHKALLNKKEVLIRNNVKSGEIETIPTGEIDTQAVKAGLDMAYKLKKKYGEITINHKFSEYSDEELEGEIAGEVSEALGAIAGEAPQEREQ